MAVTPVILAAVLTAAPRFAKELLLASTSGMWQSGHVAETMSRSSEISCAQPPFVAGYDVPPRWSILRKQPFAVVQAGSPNWARYVARSASAVGSLWGSPLAPGGPEDARLRGW